MKVIRVSAFSFSLCALLWASSCSPSDSNSNGATIVHENTQPKNRAEANENVEIVSSEKKQTEAQEIVAQKKEDAPGIVVQKGPATRNVNGVKTGKYGCVASKYNNGEYEFIPRGSVILKDDGSYTYRGFESPSSGEFETDNAGNILFRDGYLKDGKAEKTDREGKYLLTFPSNPDNRWTMSYAD